MEEMQNLNVEDTVTEAVEVVTEKLTFKENLLAYGMAGIFATGLVTIGYLGYKGTKGLYYKIKDKRESKVEAEVVDKTDEDTDYDDFENNENDSEK